MQDTFQHQGQRRRLVAAIHSKGITDLRVLEAMGKVPRHLFMESYLQSHSYTDRAFPIGSGQTISQPYTVAFQTQLLAPEAGQRILEIGTGSGYQTAILADLGCKVFSIERQHSLHVSARKRLAALGYKAQLHYGDGNAGLPSYGPYAGIVVTAGADELPPALLQQLRIGGRLVIPLGTRESQLMCRFTRVNETEFDRETFGEFVFVPLLPGTQHES